MSRVVLESRQKIYLILAFVSLTFLFLSIGQIKPVLVSPEDVFGLASHLTPLYWIGLALLLIASVGAFLDHEMKKDGIFIVILIVLSLFLFGVGVFAYANARIPDSYYPSAEVTTILATHHIPEPGPFQSSYFSWPGMHFISAFIVTVTGTGLDFVKYTPVFLMCLLILIAYAMGKRLGLSSNRCFLLSFMVLSSWLGLYYYCGAPLGALLYLIFFMLLLLPKRTSGDYIIILITFGALVMTHGLFTLAALLGLAFISLYRREASVLELAVVIFAAWYIYQASLAIAAIVPDWWAHPMRNIFAATNLESYPGTESMARVVTRYSQLFYLALYAVLVGISAVLMITKRRIPDARRKLVMVSFLWAIGAALLIVVGYQQVFGRVYAFTLVPAVCIVVLSLADRKIMKPVMVALICVLPLVSLLATYGGEAAFSQVRTTELKGAEFFAERVNPQTLYFYQFNTFLIDHYNPALLSVPAKSSALLQSKVDFSVMSGLKYVVLSWQGSDSLVYAWGEDPYTGWLETEAGKSAALLYTNGYFQVYENHLSR
jgi:hypothetical protein